MNKFLVSGICVTILLLGVAGCAPRVAEDGDVVSVEYTGELLDGTEFDSSVGGAPYQFQLGKGEVVPGFENAVLGMQVDETKTVEIPCEEAYGIYHEELLFQLPKTDFPADAEFKLGATVVLRGQDVSVRGVITDIGDTIVTVDANHPLAGETLVFHLELLKIDEPS